MINSKPDPEVHRKASISMIQRWGVIVLTLLLLIPSVEALAEDPKPLPALKTGTPATYTSVKRFPQNLAGNFLALFSEKNIYPLLIGGAASAIAAQNFDDEILHRRGVRWEPSAIGEIGGTVGGPVVVISTVTGLLIGGHYSKNERFHSFTYALAQGTVINEGMVQGLKVAFGRTRPDGSDNRSLPSGHAATAFMIATIAQRYYGRTAGIIGYSAATFIAFSRLRANKHWVSDLTAGATLGYIVGSSVCRRTGISMRVGKITLVPAFDLKHRRVGISFFTDLE